MEVKIKINELGLSINKYYFVYELIRMENNQFLIRIENDDKQIFTYDIRKFVITDETKPERWITVSRENEVIKTFLEFSKLDFWEKFYNDDSDALRKFHGVKVNMFAMNINSEKVNSILSFSDCDEQIFLLNSLKSNLRDEFIKYMKAKGIDCRQMINPVFDALYLKKKFISKNFINSSYISRNSVHLPSGTGLKKKDIDYICKMLKLFFK